MAFNLHLSPILHDIYFLIIYAPKHAVTDTSFQCFSFESHHLVAMHMIWSLLLSCPCESS